MATVAWFHPFNGTAGDMMLGSLLDAGADVDAVREALHGLRVPGWRLDVEPVQRNGIGATRAVVTTEDQSRHRPASAVLDLIDAATLPARAHRRARATFERLARVEGRIHGVDPLDVELHEVGALDSIVDVVGVCVALDLLGIDDVRSAAVTVGTGTMRAAHGVLPNPGPAVVALLADAGAPVIGVDVAVELATPTGVALLSLASGWGPMPAMTPQLVGYGAGTRELADRPNVIQVVVGEAAPTGPSSPAHPVLLLEANVDDVTGEVLAYVVAALLDAGAHDAWVTPIVMKKGRPAHTVHALVDPALVAAVAAVLARESGTLGLRATTLERWPLARAEHVVDIDGRPVRVKVGAGRAKVEHDDAARAAAALGLPLREVLRRAEGAAHDGA